MANVNDYIILNKKADKYAKLLADNVGTELSSLSGIQQRRLGFYIYILENICNQSDVSDLIEYIIDTEFNKHVFNVSMNDNGMDAVYINDETKEVKLFNFKFREKFNADKSQELNDNFTSTKFLNLVLSDDKQEFKKYHEKIREKLFKLSDIFIRPQEEWDVTLYQVSNEAKEVIEANNELDHLARLYAIQIKAIALPTISTFMSIRPRKINAKVILDNEAVMCYSEDSKASAKSYIARLRCSDILRMTCDVEEYRDSLQPIESNDLAGSYLDFGVLFDNVRGLVKNSKYNSNIADTLKDNPKKFFMYNNGITLIAEYIKSKPLPGNKSLKLEISNFQIVNGGQTIRTIHDFNKRGEDNLETYLYDSEVLVRMFMPDAELNEAHKIAEFTNSQNPIKTVHLKSLASEQIDIERYLDEHDIAYARKTGDTGPCEDKDYKFTINMETFGKILKAKSGQPEKATNSVKDIFEKDYKKLFITDFNITEAPQLIEKFYSIIKFYKSSIFKGNQLKYFYIIFFEQRAYEAGINQLIADLEDFLASYETEKDIGEVKILGSVSFKDAVAKFLDNKYLA